VTNQPIRIPAPAQKPPATIWMTRSVVITTSFYHIVDVLTGGPEPGERSGICAPDADPAPCPTKFGLGDPASHTCSIRGSP
jgi:hypothetical protein